MRCDIELIENVYRAWPRFDPTIGGPHGEHVPDVGVLRLKFRTGHPAKSNDEMIAAAAPGFARLLERSRVNADGFNAAVFATNRIWQPDNRIIRYKKLWRSASRSYDLAGLTTGDELLIEDRKGIRFAASAEIDPLSFKGAFQIAASSHYSSFILLTKRAELRTEAFAREMYDLSFPAPHNHTMPRDGDLNLANVCLFSCLRGEIVVSCGFEWDHSVWYVDAFAKPSTLALLQQSSGVLNLSEKH